MGIGTSLINGTGEAALTVMNGNVGIGTWVPTAPLAVGANAFTVNSNGAITTSGAYTQSGSSANTLTGNTAFNATKINAVLRSYVDQRMHHELKAKSRASKLQ